MRTIVYVDGFNFYYGCCRGTPHRWVNPWRVAEHLLPAPDHELVALFYFTAAIKPQPHDPAQRQRQECYWRALHTTHPSRVLTAEVNFVKHIREGVMARSQFPPTLTDARGTFHKPASW